MYKHHFDLVSKPFSLLPDPSFLYLSKKHALAYAMLEYGLESESGGFIVLTGEIGSGKTTLISKLINTINNITIGLVSYTSGDFEELLQLILMSFKLEYRNKSKIERYQDLMNYLELQYSKNKRCILIIDEAQNIDIETLEQIRMLTNINSDKGQKIQVVLSGQPEFLENLKSPGLVQFSQRVSVQYNIEALSKEECIEYISHRLTIAGGDIEIFDEISINWVWYYSRGIPRVINSICDLALVYGYAEQKKVIDLDVIKFVIRDRKAGGLFVDFSEITNVEEIYVSEN